jgi:hypothetical protein
VCFVVICVPFCFIVMYVVSLFRMLSYCLVGWYYLSYVCFLFCMVAFYIFCCYCIVHFVLLFFSPSSSYIVFVLLYLYIEHCHRVETQLQLIIIIMFTNP